MNAPSKLESGFRVACRALLRLYPRSFREEYGKDLVDTAVDRLRSARAAGLRHAIACLVGTAGDLAAHGMLERANHLPRSLHPLIFYGQDVRHAGRRLSRSPFFTVLTVLVLGGGLGVSIFTWSFLHTAVLKPLPVEDGGRVVKLLAERPDGSLGLLDAADVALIRPGVTTITGLGVYASRAAVVGVAGAGFPLEVTTAEWHILDAARVRPALGRVLRPGDGEPGAEPVIVLGYHAWRDALGADTAAIGSVVPVNGVATRIVGVMPEGFGFPVASEAWAPIAPEVLRARRHGEIAVNVYGRLAEGLDPGRAEAELSLLLGQAREDAALAADPSAPVGIAVQSFPMSQVGEEAPLFLVAVNGVASLILLLACVNVANLLLARANEHDREIAVRLALGAPRPRLIMQQMWETILLCLVGGGLATGVAVLGLDFVNAWARSHLEGNLPFWWVWGYDSTVLLTAGGFVTVTAALLGAVISWRTSEARVHSVLGDAGPRGGGRHEGRLSRLLVVTQVAVVSVLLFIGSLSAVVAYRVARVELGYDSRGLLRAELALPLERYPDPGRVAATFTALAMQLEGRKEIDGLVLRTPLGEPGAPSGTFEIAGQGIAPGQLRPAAFVLAALGPLTPLGIGLREGRFFDGRDGLPGVRTALVSRSLADRFWPGESPIGRQLRPAGVGDTTAWHTVVGVVDDVLLGNPLSRDRSALAIYLPLAQTGVRHAEVLFRHAGGELAARNALLETVAGADPLLIPDHVGSFDEMLGKMTLVARSVTTLFGGCFLFALVLAVSGTYGLMARSVGRRTREIGVRRALGATDGVIIRMLLRQGSLQLGIGAAVALPLTLAAGVVFSRFFPVPLSLPLGLAFAVAAVVATVVLVATYVPSRRAVRLEPRDALWRE